jgi:hypothetical protein
MHRLALWGGDFPEPAWIWTHRCYPAVAPIWPATRAVQKHQPNAGQTLFDEVRWDCGRNLDRPPGRCSERQWQTKFGQSRRCLERSRQHRHCYAGERRPEARDSKAPRYSVAGDQVAVRITAQIFRGKTEMSGPTNDQHFLRLYARFTDRSCRNSRSPSGLAAVPSNNIK